MKHTILLLVSILVISVSATSRNYYLSGIVLDKSSGRGVENVNISFTGSRAGSVTDGKGKFHVVLDTLPVNLIISHVGYKTYRQWLTSIPESLTILLEPSTTILEEVKISGVSAPVAFYKDDKFSIIDYEIDNNLVYLLIFKSTLKKAFILCETLSGDTIAASSVLPFKPVQLFYDCMNNIHVLSSDSAFQIYFDNNELELSYGFEIRRFWKTLGKCVASTSDDLYFREQSPAKMSVFFYQINKISKRKQFFASAIDAEKINLYSKNPEDLAYLMMGHTPGLTDPFEPTRLDLINSRAAFENFSYVHKVLYRANTSFLQRVQDHLFVFNTATGLIESFDLDGNQTDSIRVKVNNVQNGIWKKEFYADNDNGKIYTVISKHGILSLYRVNLKTGLIKEILTIKHEFPQNLKIYNDCLFYLYDVFGSDDNKALYKQKL